MVEFSIVMLVFLRVSFSSTIIFQTYPTSDVIDSGQLGGSFLPRALGGNLAEPCPAALSAAELVPL